MRGAKGIAKPSAIWCAGRDVRTIEASTLEGLLDQSVALVSVMYANNETGVIQPVVDLAHAAHKVGAFFHTDAVQAFGRIPLEVEDVDALTVAAHKIGGPLGIAAVLRRPKVIVSKVAIHTLLLPIYPKSTDKSKVQFTL